MKRKDDDKTDNKEDKKTNWMSGGNQVHENKLSKLCS